MTLTEVCQNIHNLWPWFWPSVSIILGAVFGSFLGCALYRVPQKKSLWHPASFCPSCKNTLKAQDLVPIASWFFYGGRCRMCKTRLSTTYLWVEGTSIALALFSFYIGGVHIKTVFLYSAFLSVFFTIIIFIKHRITAYKSVAFALLCICFYIGL